ncbi:ABC transporter permease [Candidatus Aerophobetes bacterium]|uniref:ABC transporter permease n=1 Tax=Aerophobetes bacterium TaxID=2030807 RepID=A0A2A4X375_UNCAE|nr:MAG: ABC transporter permease [Candidatus Aerophobetes bacterium]
MKYLLDKFRFLFSTGEYVSLIWTIIVVTIRRPPRWALIREQLYHMGVLSLPVVAMTGFSTGLVLAAQSFFQLSDKGLASATGLMVAKAMFTELGPVLTAFMVTGRVGAAMCAELGSMRVTEQIDALETMAIDPNRYLVAPRFISGVFMVPLLTIFSSFMGVFGGYLLAIFYFNMPPATYFDPMQIYITDFDLVIGFVKSVFFGVIMVTVSCYKGLKTTGGAAGVGKSTTNSVVICYTLILFSNFFITLGLNLVRTATGWFSS